MVSLQNVVHEEMINGDLLPLSVSVLWHMVYETIRDRAVKACFMDPTQHLGNDSQLCSWHLTAALLSNAGGNQGLEMYKT